MRLVTQVGGKRPPVLWGGSSCVALGASQESDPVSVLLSILRPRKPEPVYCLDSQERLEPQALQPRQGGLLPVLKPTPSPPFGTSGKLSRKTDTSTHPYFSAHLSGWNRSRKYFPDFWAFWPPFPKVGLDAFGPCGAQKRAPPVPIYLRQP